MVKKEDAGGFYFLFFIFIFIFFCFILKRKKKKDKNKKILSTLRSSCNTNSMFVTMTH